MLPSCATPSVTPASYAAIENLYVLYILNLNLLESGCKLPVSTDGLDTNI